jgi:hypothetical protein
VKVRAAGVAGMPGTELADLAHEAAPASSVAGSALRTSQPVHTIHPTASSARSHPRFNLFWCSKPVLRCS